MDCITAFNPYHDLAGMHEKDAGISNSRRLFLTSFISSSRSREMRSPPLPVPMDISGCWNRENRASGGKAEAEAHFLRRILSFLGM